MRFKHLLKRYDEELISKRIGPRDSIKAIMLIVIPRLGNYPRIPDKLIDFYIRGTK
jgi:hypothetical protein